MSSRLKPGDTAPDFNALSLDGGSVSLRDFQDRRVLLKFHRFVGCTVCEKQVDDWMSQHRELEALGLDVLAVFRSPIDDLAGRFFGGHPRVRILEDPDEVICRAYGVGGSWVGLFTPRPMFMLLREMLSLRFPDPRYAPALPNSMPADFLIDEHGIIRYAHYGSNAADSMNVHQVMRALEQAYATA